MNRLIVICLLLCFACKDKTGSNGNTIPDKYVDVYVNTILPQYQQLDVIGGWTYYPGGNRGLFIYHTIDDEIVAFDRNCSYNPLDSCATVSLDSSEAFLRCGSYKSTGWKACCNTRFNLDGAPYQGPARSSLRQYYVTRNGASIRITSFQQ